MALDIEMDGYIYVTVQRVYKGLAGCCKLLIRAVRACGIEVTDGNAVFCLSAKTEQEWPCELHFYRQHTERIS